MGRVKSHKQETDGETYTTSYEYNLSGAMIEQTYPSGRKVKNVLNNDGELSLVQSKKNANFGYFDYAKSFTYNATGATQSMQLGNGKWESTTFNSRLQPTNINLGTTQGGNDKLNLVFDYGSTNNNGNVLSQTIVVPTVGNDQGFTAIQTYNYDELNRLKSAEEKIANVISWKQTFTFDRYGNKRFDEANTDTLQGGCAAAVCNPTIDPATNKLIGYTFDNSGNTKVDTNGQTFTYDGENKQILVKDSSNNTVGEYFYDGDGKRVKKIVGSEETIFVYNASGQLVAEYSNQISQTPKVSYLTSDHLGSPRITTDKDGDVYTRRDFMPFGEEIDANDTPERTATLNYATDEIRRKFASYDRDNETDLDFAKARMYANELGRFTTVDPIMISKQRIIDPQAVNLFIYTRNNPLKYIDPNGKYFVGIDGEKVDVKYRYDIDGNVAGIKLGKNATQDLKDMAALVNSGKSGLSITRFKTMGDNATRINFKIDDSTQNTGDLGDGLLGLHQAHDKDGNTLVWANGPREPNGQYLNGRFAKSVDSNGDEVTPGTPEYITGNDGKLVYKEVTITIFTANIDQQQIDIARFDYGDNRISKNDLIISVFTHEGNHNINNRAITAIRGRQNGAINNYNVEDSAEADELQVFREIKAKRP